MTEILFARFDEVFPFNLSNSTNLIGLLPVAFGGATGVLESFPGATSTVKLQNAIASGATYVQLSQDITITAQIDLPANFILDGNWHQILQGASLTRLFTMSDNVTVINTRFNGNGGVFTGKMFEVIAGNYQRFVNVNITNSDNFVLDFNANFGQNFVWDTGTAQRTVSTNPAIRTVSELQTSGGRYFINVNMNGGWGYDIGGHFTVIQGGSMVNLTFRSTSSYVFIGPGTRIASSPTIIGANHTIQAVFDAGVTLGDNTGTYPSGASLVQSTIYQQFGLSIIDHSNSNTNTIESAPGNTFNIFLGGVTAGLTPALRMFQNASTFLEIGTDGALGNSPYIHSQNSTVLSFGINTTSFWTIGTDGGFYGTSGVTGGDKGVNTLNAVGLFVNGVAVLTTASTASALTSFGTSPIANTAAQDTNTTQIATTAFVIAQAAAVAPLINATTAVVGTSLRFARQDHVHPSDITGTGVLRATITGVNFNLANNDNAIVLPMPVGFTRAMVLRVNISNPSATMAGNTFGLFSATAGGGLAIAPTQANTITATTDATVNNALSVNGAQASFVVASLTPAATVQFRTTVAAAATGDVTVEYMAIK